MNRPTGLDQIRKGAERQRDFHKLWAAESISLFGSAISALALPLTAITLLNASALQVGLLRMAGEVPFPMFSLFAGVWLDRVKRRPLLITADILRGLLLLSVPVAALIGRIHLVHIGIVLFGLGTLTVVFEVAHYAYVPVLVKRTGLVDSNSKLQVSHSVAELGGPGIAGLLVQFVSAPFAILADSFSYFASAILLGTIRTAEVEPGAAVNTDSIWKDIRDGLHALFGHALLRVIIVASIMSVGFSSAVFSIYILYLSRDLSFSPATIGLIFAIGGAASIGGAMVATRVAARIGVGRSIIGGWLIEGVGRLLIPLAMGPAALPILIVAQLMMGGMGTIANIHQWTFRQNAAPDHLLARVTASHRFTVWGTGALGALLGGVLGSWLGLQTAMLICAVAAFGGPVYAFFTPLWKAKEQPKGNEA
jgi:predicted MFS family arabinose efflux permease